MKFPTLYAKDSKGKTRQWTVEAIDDRVIVTYGLIDGKQATVETKSIAKNTGKANATTAEEQAIRDAQSKWTYQIEREDYAEDVEKSGMQLRPMLALDYLKVPHRVNLNDVIMQPKLDGLRLLAGYRYRDKRVDEIEFMSRKGETYELPHIKPEYVRKLIRFMNYRMDEEFGEGKYECLAIDGELYLHGLSLQEITSRARRYQEGLTEELRFHVFDAVVPGLGFEDRFNSLVGAKLLMSNIPTYLFPTVETVYHSSSKYRLDEREDWPGLLADSFEEYQSKCLINGYEGIMIRHGSGEYAIGNRSADLFKFKQFQEKECIITDVWEDKFGNAMFKCLWDHNNPSTDFNLTPKRTHDERKEILDNASQYVGKWITVKYQALTNDGLPQFPVGLGLRECDENGVPIV